MGPTEPTVPKPLVEIGGKPILWHVMRLYASQGMTRFVLLLGHGAEQLESFAKTLPRSWDVVCVRTGIDTPTGGRLARARSRLDGEPFCVTYADGLADIDLRKLLEFHRSHTGLATMTVVRPPNPWGVASIGADGQVTSFEEKEALPLWVNGGFFVMEPQVLELLHDEASLEEGALQWLSDASELYAFSHSGFWACMDTYKDALILNRLWQDGAAPWRQLVA
jgi:glucose-1-phosphate cytidylyltransferase